VQGFGDEAFGGLEIEPFHLHRDVENTVRFLLGDAGAEGAAGPRVKAPRGVMVVVIGIGAGDMRPALAPGNAEHIENIGLAAFDRGADIRRAHEADAAAVHRRAVCYCMVWKRLANRPTNIISGMSLSP
jgi:hypothetical protein